MFASQAAGSAKCKRIVVRRIAKTAAIATVTNTAVLVRIRGEVSVDAVPCHMLARCRLSRLSHRFWKREEF